MPNAADAMGILILFTLAFFCALGVGMVVLYRKRKEEGFKKLGDKAGEGKPGLMATSSGESKADPSVLAVELAPA